jgi:hypothetical protein
MMKGDRVLLGLIFLSVLIEKAVGHLLRSLFDRFFAFQLAEPLILVL